MPVKPSRVNLISQRPFDTNSHSIRKYTICVLTPTLTWMGASTSAVLRAVGRAHMLNRRRWASPMAIEWSFAAGLTRRSTGSRAAGGREECHLIGSHSRTPSSLVPWLCYTEKAPKAWQRRGTQKTRNTYHQPNRPNRQTSQTKHQALPKGQPGRRITPINTAAVHASAQQQPTISTHTRQGHHQIFSSNAARCEAQQEYRRAG